MKLADVRKESDTVNRLPVDQYTVLGKSGKHFSSDTRSIEGNRPETRVVGRIERSVGNISGEEGSVDVSDSHDSSSLDIVVVRLLG